jgi:hypothetical protein
MDLIQDCLDWGFISGKIKFGKYEYKIRLITNNEFEEYLELIKDKSRCLEALRNVVGKCLFREVKKEKIIKRRLFKKPITETIIENIFDFDIGKYPACLKKKFLTDLFKILFDKDFFQQVIARGDVHRRLEK